MSNGQLIALVLPLVALQLGLMIFALRDLLRPERQVAGGNKVVWGVVIVLGEMLGPIVYLLFGRREA
ncbi:MAG TPA: PLD nuclease N-terminal domain-containing protein [Candidatus Dormibacteraeota bacterium]|nr:PLD nuclease N-terminal domain-containing protein [Candidatus Dormibacteraeota bacterium]